MVLPCVFNGNPVPTLTWSKYLAPLPADRTAYMHGEENISWKNIALIIFLKNKTLQKTTHISSSVAVKKICGGEITTTVENESMIPSWKPAGLVIDCFGPCSYQALLLSCFFLSALQNVTPLFLSYRQSCAD